MLSALDMYNKTAIEISSKRTDTPLVDEVALREALMNSILHVRQEVVTQIVRNDHPICSG